jgi:geranylgeranyl diphosphate synthase type I
VNGSVAQASWLEEVVGRSNARLAQFFAEKQGEASRTSPAAPALLEAVAEFTLRGGKRLRPAAVYAAFRAVCPDGELTRTLDVGAALELLQSYFLIQDDWMDGDDERRGGPAVHAALRRQHGDSHLGASLAMLAADLASGFAWELAAIAPFPAARLREGLAVFGRMHFEVVCGQQLDLLEHADVALVHQLKTGSYTVRGPCQLGALLGDASAAQLDALTRFATPLGLAFQLRDDLLSVFGDRTVVGKPVGNDLRAGKRTALVSEAERLLSGHERALFDDVLGNPDATDEAVASVGQALLDSGVREQLEARVGSLLDEAHGALTGAPLGNEGVAMLDALAHTLARRER